MRNTICQEGRKEGSRARGRSGHDNHRPRPLSIIMAIHITTNKEGRLSAVTNTNAINTTSSGDE
jgi:hypothetical protein